MSKNIATKDVVDWLLEGDPSVAWQTMRDVVGAPEAKWRPVRERVATEGWGRRLLELRDKKKGTWGRGIYAPKWISTTYTLLLLRDMGLPQDNAAGHKGASLLLGGGTESKLAGRVDLCVIAMYQTLMAYFGVNDERIDRIIRLLLSRQMADGGWNCSERRHVVTHGSLHSTISVLESLAQYAQARGASAAALVAPAVRRGQEFILMHRLFKSDKTGKVIREHFTKFSFPPRWHWDVLRGLDYLCRVNAPRDERVKDAIDLLLSKQTADGTWKLENHHKGKEFFRLETPGRPSRWNTLRALRVLRWWKA